VLPVQQAHQVGMDHLHNYDHVRDGRDQELEWQLLPTLPYYLLVSVQSVGLHYLTSSQHPAQYLRPWVRSIGWDQLSTFRRSKEILVLQARYLPWYLDPGIS
jgi:hypothetical protein